MNKGFWIGLFLGLWSSLSASHIVGGHFEVTQLNDSLFKIDLVILRDCSGILPRSVYSVRVLHQQDSSLYKNIYLDLQPGEPIAIGDSCFSPPSLCIEKWIATDTVVLEGNPDGYFLVAQEYARNPGIANIQNNLFDDVGMTWLIKIPDPDLQLQNSSPVLKGYPPDGYLCINMLKEIDFSATDPDGDSLAYKMVRPLEGHEDAAAGIVPQPLPKFPPYPPVTWAPGYSLANITPGPVPLEIDPATGMVRAHPDEFGIFVFSYVVEEYRDGIKIGEVRRDLQLEVLTCEINEKPEFLRPEETGFSTLAEEELCVPVLIKDPNPDDTLEVSTRFSFAVGNLSHPPDISLMERVDTGTSSGSVCWTPSCSETFRDQKLEFEITAVSYGCDGNDTISEVISMEITPLAEEIPNLIPNVFTPNEDGVNDVFRLQDELVYPCLSDLNIRIFNRWGVEVYQNQLHNRFGWDGRYRGKDAAEGVYYYIISGNYGNDSFEAKGFLTLMR